MRIARANCKNIGFQRRTGNCVMSKENQGRDHPEDKDKRRVSRRKWMIDVGKAAALAGISGTAEALEGESAVPRAAESPTESLPPCCIVLHSIISLTPSKVTPASAQFRRIVPLTMCVLAGGRFSRSFSHATNTG